MLNKRANGSVILLVIVIILFAIVEIVAHPEVFSPRECTGTEECWSNQYCGSDFKCHEIPASEVVNEYNDFTAAGLFIAIAIIIAAIILKIRWVGKVKDKVTEEDEENNNNEEPKYVRVG